jgi:hypothetical protein
MQRDEDDLVGYDDEELQAFAHLDREAPVAPGEVDRVIRILRNDGTWRPRRRGWRHVALAAAAGVMFAAGLSAGAYFERRGSLEDMLTRTDLDAGERVLLLQRAGSAYVRAAQSYADATARADSTAIEVASQVLVGAAHAVARTSLDAGMAVRLAEVLRVPAIVPVAMPRKPVLWF